MRLGRERPRKYVAGANNAGVDGASMRRGANAPERLALGPVRASTSWLQ